MKTNPHLLYLLKSKMRFLLPAEGKEGGIGTNVAGGQTAVGSRDGGRRELGAGAGTDTGQGGRCKQQGTDTGTEGQAAEDIWQGGT